MRVLISGASGFIGRALCAHLADAGDEVLRLVRRPVTRTGEIEWDPSGGSVDMAALSAGGALDGVVHLAAAGIADRRWTKARKRLLRESRIQGTHTLATALAALDTPPGVLVSGSAVGIYGDREDAPLDENASHGSGFLADLCRDWEEAASPAKAAGIRLVHLRTGVVLHPSGGALAKMLPPFRFGLGGPLGNGRQFFPWISRTDMVRTIQYLIATQSISGPVNATAPDPVTNAAFTRALGKALKRPAFLPMPGFVMSILFGEVADEALLASQRVLPRVLQQSGFKFTQPDLGAALSAMLR